MNRRDRLSRLRSTTCRRRSERRGVLLLVVLSMLVLFLLLGTTFLLTSGQYRTAAKIVEKAHRTTFQPADLLERALMQLVRDTNNTSSVLRYHSLLRDMYGVDGFIARPIVTTGATLPNFASGNLVAAPQIVNPHFAGQTTTNAAGQPRGPTAGQFVEFYVLDADQESVLHPNDANVVGLEIDQSGLPSNHALSRTSGYYEGCLLTFMTGPCRGSSVRVVGYDYLGETPFAPTSGASYAAPVARFRVVAPRRTDGRSLNVTAGVISDLVEGTLGSRFLVNGRPFNGAGVGFNPLALSSSNPQAPLPRLSALELFDYDQANGVGYGLERALIPNPVHYFESSNVALNPSAGVNPWARPYNRAEFLPLTRGFVPSGDPAYNAATSPLYKTFAGPGDTDESYDAPDTQNMALAMQSLEPRLRGRVAYYDTANSRVTSVDPDAYYSGSGNQPAPAYLNLDGVTIPSFHRPELANFWLHRFMNATGFWGSASTNANELSRRVRAILEPYNAAGAPQHGLNANQAAQITLIKRKFLLRPLREDHPDFDGSNPLSAYGTTTARAAFDNATLVNAGTGEVTFPYWEAVGPWDVDNDGDGVNDSIWVDIGLPVQQTEDGRWYKPLVAMLVEDLDGRLNLNAHGSEADLVAPKLLSSQFLNDYSNVNSAPIRANLAMDSQRLQQTITGSTAFDWLRSSDQLAPGVGWGVAETSLRPILSPALPTVDAMTPGAAFTGDAQYDDYARLLYGRPDPAAAGRNAARALRESVAFGRYGSMSAGSVFASSNAALYPDTMLTKPGSTYVTDSGRTSRQALSSVREPRTPLEFMGYPAYTGAFVMAGVAEQASGFTSPPDLRGRLATGLSGAGAPVAEAVAEANSRGITWRELAENAPDDSPYEVDLSIAARNQPPAYLDDIRRSYYNAGPNGIDATTAPINDDAPFSAAELERILRTFDADAEKLPNRLWKAVDAFDPTKLVAASRWLQASDEPNFVAPSLDLAVAGAEAAVTRRQVTTDSWDLPVPNENLYDRLVLGADGKPGVPEFQSIGTWVNSVTLPADDDGDGLVDEGDEAIAAYNATGSHIFVRADGTQTPRAYDQLFNAGCDDYVVVMRQDPPTTARLTDYLKYRIALEMLRNGRIPVPPAALSPAQLATYHNEIDRLAAPILFGGELAVAAAATPTGLGSIGGLLAPELLAGRRMDLNRPFGDGRDNGGVRLANGTVDEPSEAGDAYADLNRNGQFDAGEPWLDLDGDGAPSFHAGGNVNTSLDYVWVDANGDGVETPAERKPFRHVPLHETFVDRNGVRVYNPQMARQLFARHLYCLMLALQDENYLAPYDSEDPQVLHYLDPLSGMVVDAKGASPESGEAFRIAFDLHAIVFRQEIADGTVTANHTLSLTDPALESRRLLVLNRARQLAQRKLTCRHIAQWAVNVVDFRDPDAIQTAFEYDENPWDGWNVVDTLNGNRVYPLDGDLTTDENLTMHRQVTGGAFSAPVIDAPDAEQARRWIPRKDWTRGVVWGAERPEVLLTEGVAWHDRRLEDLESLTKNQNNNPDDGGKVTGLQNKKDDDLDQLRKPKGFAYIEAINPHVGDDQRPAELYSSVDATGNTAISSGVRLDRLSNGVQDPNNVDNQGRNLTHSPVWRIAVVEEHPLVRNATVAGSSVSNALGQASDDPVTETVQQYLQQSILWGPWIYGSDADLTTLVPGINVPLLPNAYREYHATKKIEVNFALLTQAGLATGRDLTDADGVGVAAGVVERAPTVPDTSFPAFDGFAQPDTPFTKELSLSSKADAKDAGGQGSGSFVRGMLTKPTTFIERVFYLAPAVNLARAPGYSGASTGDYPAANLTDPGLWVPLLAYDVPANYRDGTRLGHEGPQVGVTTAPDTGIVGGSATKSVRVFASKFANVYDRFDANQNGDLTETFALAPLLPGRRAVIGTTGDVYGDNTKAVTPQEMNDPFAGSVAMRMDRRYAAVISQFPATTPGRGLEDTTVSTPKAVLRRLEMVPSPDPNRHQFAIRMNGLNESQSVSITGRPVPAFNLTGGEGTGQAIAALSAVPPVIAIPIDHFSISEPLDEYLVRQIELDSGLTHYPQPGYVKRAGGQGYPAEEYFATSPSNKAGKHFDEPFDIHPELVENQTTPNYRSVHLERLANPLLPWNPPPVRPDGQVITQHQPNLPVNPYLPVDARSLDLTAFNSFTDAEKDLAARGTGPVAGEFVNGATAYPRGPEERHRLKRSLDDLLTAVEARETVIGFASNERGRIPGPFPLLWMMEPARLLWRQAGPSTFSEIAHSYASGTNTHNGYLARARDQLAKPQTGGGTAPGDRLGIEGTHYDSYQISTTPYVGPTTTEYKIDQYVDVAWRLTLGFSDWMSGEFHTGSALRWLTETDHDGPIEDVDLDGNGAAGDLASRPEVNSLLASQTLAPNGMPSAVNNANLSGTNAREFMEAYLRTQVAEQGTTPEFAWPNRPLASAGELLQVPAWGGSRMLTYYSVFNWQYTQNPHFSRRTQVNPYDGEAVIFHDGLDYDPGLANPSGAGVFDGDFSNDGPSDTVTDTGGVQRPQAGSTNVVRFRDMLGHFGHLINFFQTARFPSIVGAFARVNADGKPEDFVVPRGASHHYRVLDYVCVPSRFTATDTILNADTFGAASYDVGDSRVELAMPFNRVDNYREPGRVNLNTIVGRHDATEPSRRNPENPDGSIDSSRTVPRLPDSWSEVYDGLMHRVKDESVLAPGSLLQQGHLGPAWRDVALSRRGYVQAGFNPALSPTEESISLASARQNQVDYSPMRMHPDFPTLFANPFRAPGEGANVPLANMVQTGVDATMLRAHPLSPGADGAWGRRGVDGRTVNKSGSGTAAENNGNRNDAGEAGILPMHVGDAPALNVVDRLGADTVLARFMPDGNRRGAVPDTFMDDVFRARGRDPNPRNETPQSAVLNTEVSKRSTAVPLFSGASLEPSLDTERNPTQRYLPIQRMANLATTRSNVYAVWITVGFFEVKQAKNDQRVFGRYMTDTNGDNIGDNFQSAALQELFFRVYPDGWTLGEEIGRDTGQDVRHRGFYVVDRSRPVAFKPGEDANVSDTVLVRRRIQ